MPATIVVRPARSGDAAAVRALAEAFTPQTANLAVEEFRARFEELARKPDWCLPVARLEGCVVGYALAQDLGPGLRARFTTGRIHDLYVDPAARTIGAGTALVGQVFDWARSRPQEMILDWQASPSAVGFYERLGFAPDRTGDFAEFPGFTLDLRGRR